MTPNSSACSNDDRSSFLEQSIGDALTSTRIHAGFARHAIAFVSFAVFRSRDTSMLVVMTGAAEAASGALAGAATEEVEDAAEPVEIASDESVPHPAMARQTIDALATCMGDETSAAKQLEALRLWWPVRSPGSRAFVNAPAKCPVGGTE
jgi:hypothetical protein